MTNAFYRSPAATSILVNGVELRADVRRTIISLKENEHEKAQIFIRSRTSGTDYVNLPNQRIEFAFGMIGNKTTFQGYISEVVPHQYSTSDGVSVSEQEIVCLGPTMLFKGNRPRFWDNTTATDAMRSIVSDQNLGFSDENHNDTYQWRTMAQTNETDWEMLVNLATRLGCCVISHLGVVRLVNSNDVAARELPVRSFRRERLIPMRRDTDDQRADAIIALTPSNSSLRDPQFRNPQFSYLANGKSVSVTRDALPYQMPVSSQSQLAALMEARFVTDMPVVSAQEGEALMAGYYTPDWNETAEVKVMGDSEMRPCSVINIESSGLHNPKIVAYNGNWYVSEVVHAVDINQFTTQMSLGRATDRRANWYQRVPFWLGDKRGKPTLRPIGTGQWVSTWR